MPARDILFNFPQAALLLFLLIPLFLAHLALTRYRNSKQTAYNSSPLLSSLLIPRSPLLNLTKAAGWAIIWILLSLALMQPFGNTRYASLHPHSPSAAQGQTQIVPEEVIFLVDTSASMRVPDGLDGQTRLKSAKLIMEDILNQLHEGQTVSLYAFTSQLSAIVPPTLDYIFARLSIDDLHIDQGDVGGTRFEPVLTALKEQAFPKPSNKQYSIIMLTDGGDTKIENLKGDARKQAIQAIVDALPNAQEFHLHLYAVGLGLLKPQAIPQVTFEDKPVLSKLEPEILKALAQHERGKYYMAEGWTSWDLAQEFVARMKENNALISQGLQSERKVAAVQKEDVIVDLYYQIPLGLAILFYFLNLLLPDARRL